VTEPAVDPTPVATKTNGTSADGTSADGTRAHGTRADGGSGGIPRTGHPAVDAALASLGAAGELPPEEQIEAFESTHQTLRETLSTIEES
jgi:hypothetical protein